jgi:hypothetical protein
MIAMVVIGQSSVEDATRATLALDVGCTPLCSSVIMRGFKIITIGQGQDEIYFGTDAGGLTASQLSRVHFLDPLGFAPGTYDAKLLATGELVVVPEPAGATLLLLGVGSLLVRRRRKEQPTQ